MVGVGIIALPEYFLGWQQEDRTLPRIGFVYCDVVCFSSGKISHSLNCKKITIKNLNCLLWLLLLLDGTLGVRQVDRMKKAFSTQNMQRT